MGPSVRQHHFLPLLFKKAWIEWISIRFNIGKERGGILFCTTHNLLMELEIITYGDGYLDIFERQSDNLIGYLTMKVSETSVSAIPIFISPDGCIACNLPIVLQHSACKSRPLF